MPALSSDPSLLDKLVERLQSQETLDLEFKSAQGGIGKAAWDTVSAFANTSGGWLILGVNDDGEIAGVPKAAIRLKEFFDLVHNSQKISHPVCGPDDASVEVLGTKELLVIRVPAAARRNQPVYINGNPYTGTYVRRGESDYRCAKPEVDRMMREASDVAADSTVLPSHGTEDLDTGTLANYRRRYQTQNPDSPLLTLDDGEFLRAIGAWRRNREQDTQGLTVAGLLLLGREEVIREWRSRHLIDYRLLDEDEVDQRWLDRVAWEGNLLGGVDTLLPKLVEGVDVPFRLSGVTRQDQTPVHTAVREALVNLLVHADYSETAASLVTRSPAGYQFRNPGSSRVSESDLSSANRSDPRNPTLVRMFRLIGLAEEAGTGIPTILRAWRELGYRRPDVQSLTERYEFTLTLRHIHMVSEGDRNWLDALGRHWSEPEQIALVVARHEGTIDNERLRGLAGLHPTDATKVLVGLRDARHLTMEGERRGARYRLSPEALALVPGERQGDLGLDGEQDSPRPVPRLGDSGQNLGGSGSNLGDSGSNLGDLPPNLLEFAPQFAEIVEQLAERRWVPARERNAVVTRLCAVTPLSTREVALLLRRDPQTARASIRMLLESGHLEPVFPEPNHPRQRYRTASPTAE